MAQLIRTQSVAAGANFDGSAGAGLFSFDDLAALSQGYQLSTEQIGVYTTGALTSIMAYWIPPIGQIGAPILIGSAIAPSLMGPDGNSAATFCPGLAPRSSAGKFWRIALYSDGADAALFATLACQTRPA